MKIESTSLIDTHCHLTMNSSEANSLIIERAHDLGVHQMICVGAIDGDKAAGKAVALSEEFPEIWASIGIHPHDADQYLNLKTIEHLVEHPRVVAIGETGLDYFREWSDFENQRTLFKNTIAFALECKKPLIIHLRDATEDTLAILKQSRAMEVGGVVHCYGGSTETAEILCDMNFLVSFTGTLTFKKATLLRETAKNIPLSQIMLETDSPYMAPEPYRGKNSEPGHVHFIAKTLARVKELNLEEITRQTTCNAKKLFWPYSS